MKIISKFHDYYDSSSAFFDDTILLKRKTADINLEQIKVELPFKPFIIGSKRLSTTQHFSRKAVIEMLYFCGKVYPLYTIYTEKLFIERKKWGHVSQKHDLHVIVEQEDKSYFSDVSALRQKLQEENISFDMSIFEEVKEEKINRKIKELIKQASQAEISPEIFRNAGAPYFLVKDQGFCSELIVTLFPKLQDLSIGINSCQVYQEIEMFMSGVLGSQEKELIAISDRDKRDSRGFDNMSFKKRKKAK